MTEKQKSMTHRLVLMAMFVAVQIILSRFLSINLWNLKIGFSFIPIVLAGILLRPLSAGLVGLVADVLGATLFPIGAFFPGSSLTSFITAFGYGFFLHKNQSMKNIVAAVLFSEIVGTIFLNTLWISILYGAPFVAVLIPPSCTGSRHGCCGGALHLLHDKICAPDEKGILRSRKREINGAGRIGQRLRWQYCCVSDRYGLSS